ncbi:hypothetical protein C5S29_06450 [ANME-1 cluster archaeon GoMg3.2]|nr:hypothetical protein [ANME-1 cluster archaeon GoMg3.2]
MKKKRTSLKIGDSVKVKEGMPCPDFEDLCIGGWQGRVSEIGEDDDSNDFICIRWDSITLKNITTLSVIWRLITGILQTINP